VKDVISVETISVGSELVPAVVKFTPSEVFYNGKVVFELFKGSGEAFGISYYLLGTARKCRFMLENCGIFLGVCPDLSSIKVFFKVAQFVVLSSSLKYHSLLF